MVCVCFVSYHYLCLFLIGAIVTATIYFQSVTG